MTRWSQISRASDTHLHSPPGSSSPPHPRTSTHLRSSTTSTILEAFKVSKAEIVCVWVYHITVIQAWSKSQQLKTLIDCRPGDLRVDHAMDQTSAGWYTGRGNQSVPFKAGLSKSEAWHYINQDGGKICFSIHVESAYKVIILLFEDNISIFGTQS